VAPSAGAYRTTLHPYKLVFQMKTRLELSESPEISRFGLSLSPIAEICSHPPDYDYLVGVTEYLFYKIVDRIRVLEGEMVGALKYFKQLEQM
ncbi:replication factor A protein, partial [Trifolium medium]|nr:replication factor A protein [Trifolium medium]